MNFTYAYPMVSATATILVINGEDQEIILGVRSQHADTHPSKFCLPGGFLDAKCEGCAGETLEDAAARELYEELQLFVNKSRLHLFGVYSDPETDPRAHVVNVCYWIEINREETRKLQAGDDLQALVKVRFKLSPNLLQTTLDDMAFNHDVILAEGLRHYSINRDRL